MPYGDAHSFGSREHAEPVSITTLLPPRPWTEFPHIEYGGDGEYTLVVRGYLRGDAVLFDPVLRALPPLFVVRPPPGPAEAWVTACVEYALRACTTMSTSSTGAERVRLRAADADPDGWRDWGPYVSERAWGTVREDYSEYGSAWDYFPHDHARSRAYRWSEDGMAAICDRQQHWCLGLALWNGHDPILKERMFGLTGPEGNHGEDVKDYWWYLDSTPTHSWMSWRYHYPQREFPYANLVAENQRRGPDEGEYELVDTGVFDDSRYWAVTVDYAKAGAHDLLMNITVDNSGPDEATLHVLPTLWFRNTSAWDSPASQLARITARGSRLIADHPSLGVLTLAGDGEPTGLCCDNETNSQRLYGLPGRSRCPKDGINDHVVHGADTINPEGIGTKAALHYIVTVPAGERRQIRLRLRDSDVLAPDLGNRIH